MKLHVIGSSSKGNAYILQASDGHAIIIEAGVPFKDIKKAIKYKISDVEACLITHEHGDHAGHVAEILKTTNIPVFASQGTIEALQEQTAKCRRMLRPIELLATRTIHTGNFEVAGLPLQIDDGQGGKINTHDAAAPLCFHIYHKESGEILFATDTYALPFRFYGLRHLIIECNYTQAMLDENTDAGRIDRKRRERTILSHMSLENCITQIQHNVSLDTLKDITLIHLSDTNADPDSFREAVEKATGIHTQVATAGSAFDFNVQRF